MMLKLSKRFFPVIHCISPFRVHGGTGHVLDNVRTAFAGGADGVFLIGHALPYSEVLYLYEVVRKQYPNRWIGINLLDVTASGVEAVIKGYSGLSGIWMDRLPRFALRTTAEVFGGVAFKYIDSDLQGEKLSEACRFACDFVDTITTSGNKTGSPPEIEKLKAMREAIPEEKRLALASGVSVENVASFKPYVDTYLVASSITARRIDRGNQEYLVLDAVTALAAAIHS